jgi:polysaccharide export outer membrane protein
MLKAGNKLIRLILLLGFLSGCATRAVIEARSTVIGQAKSKNLPIRTIEEENERFLAYQNQQIDRLINLIKQRSESGSADASYRIGPGDSIKISVFDVPELNVEVPVRQTGQIELPLVGIMQAVGKSESELLNDLTRKLGVFVRNPQVSLSVSSYGSQKVAVVGAVSKPGSYPLRKSSNSILELLAEAGGVSDKAGSHILLVPGELSGLSETNDAEARARFALTGRTNLNMQSGIEIPIDKVLGTGGGIPVEIPMRPGDMVVIPEAGKVMLEGEIEKPGPYDVTRQMTLLGALAAAGGITYSANVEEVELIRDVGESEPLRLVVDLKQIAYGAQSDVRIRSGDVIRVPTDSSRRLGEDTFKTITNIINFGIGGTVNVAK